MADQVTSSEASPSFEAPIGFCGHYEVRLDNAMRLAIPAKFRDVLEARYRKDGTRLILVPGGKKYLRAMPFSTWTDYQRELDDFAKCGPKGRDVKVFLYGLMAECELDAQNRIKLPKVLCDLIGIERDAVVAGGGNEITIWRKHDWDEFSREMACQLPELLQTLEDARIRKAGGATLQE